MTTRRPPNTHRVRRLAHVEHPHTPLIEDPDGPLMTYKSHKDHTKHLRAIINNQRAQIRSLSEKLRRKKAELRGAGKVISYLSRELAQPTEEKTP